MQTLTPQKQSLKTRGSKLLHEWKKSLGRYWQLYLLLIPVVANFVIFHYVPMTGIQIAFKDFMLNLGTWGSEWIGFEHFERFFNAYNFWTILSNTLILSVVSLAFSFPLSVGLALLLNEIRHKKLNSALQTIFIAPHFVSTVVVVGMMQAFLSPETGVINIILEKLGFIEEGIYFTRLEQWFRPMYIIELIWKESGWGTIIYLAALSGVDEQLYEASVIDGAGRFKQLLHITLPCILPTIITLLILRMGSFLDSGFDQIYLMLNSYNRDVATVFDTYVYDVGLTGTITAPAGTTNYSYSATVGVFRSVVSLILVVTSNALAKLAGEEGVY